MNSTEYIKKERERNFRIISNKGNNLLVARNSKMEKEYFPVVYKKYSSCSNIFFNKINPIEKYDKKELNKDIENSKFKITLLNNVLNNINNKFLNMKISNYKEKISNNLIKIKNKFKKEILRYEKIIYLYKLNLFKTEENFLSVNIFKENIQKEELAFKNEKCKLIEKIIDLNILLYQYKKNTLTTENFYDLDINDLSTDEMLITKNNNVGKINKFYPFTNK